MSPDQKEKPVMVYDSDCGFCIHWVKKWESMTGGSVRFLPYQGAAQHFPQLTPEECARAIQLVMPDGSHVSGAHAVFKSLDIARATRLPHWLYEHIPLFGKASELVYQWIAHHRLFLSKLLKYPPEKKCGI